MSVTEEQLGRLHDIACSSINPAGDMITVTEADLEALQALLDEHDARPKGDKS